MPQYVVRLIGRLSPPLTIDYADLTEKLPSFSVTVKKETVKAEPQTDIQLEANEARKRLQDEISPLLTVFGFVEGRAISLTVTDIIYPNFGQATRSISTRFVQREPPPTKDEVLLKVAWATADPIYRDLLDFFTEAQAAPNPRPTGFKMVERLEQKFGNSEQKKNRTKYKNDGRKNACKELHIRESDLIRLISAYQSKFLGDRHAEYDIDYVPARLESAERAEILTLLKNIIQSYERYVCSKTIT